MKLRLPLALVLVEIVAVWVVSDVGYYQLLSLLGIGSSYSTHPFVLGAYYLGWAGVALFIFWPLYQRWKTIDVRASMFVTTIATSILAAFYLFYVLPMFPPIHWAHAWRPPTELLTASGWYFLPKSIEIVLQQLLVAAMVLAFEVRKFSLRAISLWSAVLFGGIHLLMVLDGSSPAYVAIFTASAVAAGLLFPYLMLRIKNGFIYSYFIHWGFYAVVVVLSRMFFTA